MRRRTRASLIGISLWSAACGDDGAPSNSVTVDATAADAALDSTLDDSAVFLGDIEPGPGADPDGGDGSTVNDAEADTPAPADVFLGDDALSDAVDALAGDITALEDITTVPDVPALPDAGLDTADVTGPACVTLAAGHARHVVLSRPYGAGGQQANRWEHFPLEADGTLGASLGLFEMGRATEGVIAFRADGAVGVAAQTDGTIGVFTLGPSGEVEVVHAALDPGAYVETAQFDTEGSSLYLVDPNWVNNGGGVFRAPIGCDGTVGPAVKLYESKLAHTLVLEDDAHLLAARAAVTTEEGQVHRLSPVQSQFTHVAGVNVFGDTEDILSAFAVTHDRQFALVGDNSAFSEFDNRIGVVALTPGSTLSATQVLTPIEDPVAILTSPYDNAALVVSGFDDAVRVLSYDPSAALPFEDVGEPDYVGDSPQLPGSGVLVGDSHPGLMLIVENVAVRRMRFEPSGTVTDLGLTAENDNYEGIPGAIGVQP